MKLKLIGLSQRYAAALRQHLKAGPGASMQPAYRLQDVRPSPSAWKRSIWARIHEQALVSLKVSASSNGHHKARRRFFHRSAHSHCGDCTRMARRSKLDLCRLNETLDRRTLELAATNRQLQRGIVRRKGVEAALKKSGFHYTRLLKDSLNLQEGLRELTHQVLAAQEDERKKISRELQNEIAQTLLGINVRLLTLKSEARSNTKGLKNEIASTQRLVLKSAKSVRRVAREFRNA